MNERSNHILRRFVLKGKSIDNYTADEILMFSDEINTFPRKTLSYSAPEELLEAVLLRNTPAGFLCVGCL